MREGYSNNGRAAKERTPLAGAIRLLPITILLLQTLLISIPLTGCASEGSSTVTDSAETENRWLDELVERVAELNEENGTRIDTSEPVTSADRAEESTQEAPQTEALTEVRTETQAETQNEAQTVSQTEAQTEAETAPETDDIPGIENYHGHIYTGGEYSKKYHYEADCAGKNSHEITWAEAKRRGLGPCGTCVLK